MDVPSLYISLCFEKCHHVLHMAARACSGAALSWPEMAALALQNARKASLALAEAAECLTGAAQVDPESKNIRQVPLESTPKSQMSDACRSSHPGAAECSAGTTGCSKSASRAHNREGHSKWPLEEGCLLFSDYRHHLFLGSTWLRACYAQAHTTRLGEF